MASPVYTCVPTGYLEPKIGTEGAAAWPATTVPKQFRETVSKFPNRPAMGLKRRANVSRNSTHICAVMYLGYNACFHINDSCPAVFLQ